MNTEIIAQNNQSSYEYNEDNWTEESVVSSAESLFEFMKTCHLRDARNRNDYPMLSYWTRRIDYFTQEYEICNLGHKHCDERVKIEKPDFHEKAWQMYLAWEKRLKSLIPSLRAKRQKELQEIKELADYNRLSKKFNP